MSLHKKTIEALTALKNELPLCFKWGKEKVPIAVGIHQDVLAFYANDKRFSKTALRKAISLYTSSTIYLEKMIEGKPRLNFQGQQTTRITKKEAQNAQRLLLKKREKALKQRR